MVSWNYAALTATGQAIAAGFPALIENCMYSINGRREIDKSLLVLFDHIPPSHMKPVFEGSLYEKAKQVREWMTPIHLQYITDLDLSNAELKMIPPEIANFTDLNTLNLSGNRIASIDGIEFPDSLTELNLSNNQIENIQQAVFPQFLRILNLNNNKINNLDNVVFPHFLLFILIRGNQLTSIDHLLAFYEDCTILAEGNCFSEQYINNVRESLEARLATFDENSSWLKRTINRFRGILITRPPRVFMNNTHQGFTDSVAVELISWEQEIATTFPQFSHIDFSPLSDVAQEQLEMLSRYLHRLRETAGYSSMTGGTSASKANIVRRVKLMLELACNNPDFRNETLACINEGLQSCGDRVLLIFNDIEVLWHSHQEGLTDRDARNLAIRIQRYHLLKKHASAVAHDMHLEDPIEAVLGYQISLRSDLDLPITTENMLYSSHVTRKMIRTAKKEINAISDEELLNQCPFWQNRVTQNHALQVNVINDQYTDILQDAENYFGIEDVNQRPQFLRAHQRLAEILIHAPQQIINYIDAATEIDRQRQNAISGLARGPAHEFFERWRAQI